jgi:hypothetical protein
VAEHCGCGKSYVLKLPAWMAFAARRAKEGAENGVVSPPTTVSLTASIEAIASRDADPTEQASAECASNGPVKLHRPAGRGKRLEGQKIRQKVRDEREDE